MSMDACSLFRPCSHNNASLPSLENVGCPFSTSLAASFASLSALSLPLCSSTWALFHLIVKVRWLAASFRLDTVSTTNLDLTCLFLRAWTARELWACMLWTLKLIHFFWKPVGPFMCARAQSTSQKKGINTVLLDVAYFHQVTFLYFGTRLSKKVAISHQRSLLLLIMTKNNGLKFDFVWHF